MPYEHFIELFSTLGRKLTACTNSGYDDDFSEFRSVLQEAKKFNPWFTIENQVAAIGALGQMLEKQKLQKWLSPYSKSGNKKPKRTGIIMAGNIPAVGFHDLLCVLVSGNKAVIKTSSDDTMLIKWIAEEIISIEPSLADKILFADKLNEIDAVIATGSDNTSRYFEYYFSKYPHIIRKNRNAVSVLSGNETAADLKNLGRDIFSFFGMGCRNVSKLYIPRNYDLTLFFQSIESFSSVMEHNKYMNNFDYNSAILLMNSIKFLTNNFIILKEDTAIATPVSVLNYEYYDDEKKIQSELELKKDKMQCIIGSVPFVKNVIPFGKAQQPELWDYADGVDTLDFLFRLS